MPRIDDTDRPRPRTADVNRCDLPFQGGELAVGHAVPGHSLPCAVPVIDTVGIKSDRPFAMIDWFGTPYTRALHVIERYRLLDYAAMRQALELAGKEEFLGPVAAQSGWGPDLTYKGKALQLQFTLEDEGAFTTRWSGAVTYRRTALNEWPEIACAENPFAFHRDNDVGPPHRQTRLLKKSKTWSWQRRRFHLAGLILQHACSDRTKGGSKCGVGR